MPDLADATTPIESARPMSAQDALWLTMDRPNNLMVIDGAMLLDAAPTWDALLETVTSRVLDRFGVFRCRARHSENGWIWQEDPDFDLANHVHRVHLPAPAGLRELQDYVGEQRSRPLHRDRPLWEITLVEEVVDDDGHVGAAMVARFHHAIADGVRLTQVMLSLCDTTDPHVAATVGRSTPSGSPGSMASGVLELLTDAVSDTARAVGRGAQATVRDVRSAAAAGLTWTGALLRSPSRLVDFFDAVGIDNQLANTTASVAKLALRGPTARTSWSGTPGIRKSVAWSTPLPLDDVKAAGRACGASVNDVLLAAVGGGLRRYLRDIGDDTITDIEWMVPVNLLPVEENLPDDLGNYFALVMAVLPMQPDDPRARLAEVTSRMDRIKNSAEPLVTFGMQRAISAAPGPVSTGLTNFFADKAVGVLTNVPGPRAPLSLAGVGVRQVIGFAPSSGNQPMTCTIFSYAGTVTIGFATDSTLIPDPEKLVRDTVDDLARLVDMTP